VREVVGTKVPIAASLDLHTNFTRAMFERSDALVAYRTYPHVDMGDTGARAAGLLDAMLKKGERPAKHYRTLDFFTGLPSQCSFIQPCKGIYELVGRSGDVTLSFTPGFPMADFPECGMAVFGYGFNAQNVVEEVDRLHAAVAEAEKDFVMELHTPEEAVARARQRGAPG